MPDETSRGTRSQLARAFLSVCRWKLIGGPPDTQKFVLIAAPHTSNWDLLWLLMMAWAHEIPIRWLAKAELFVGPVGWFLRSLGGVPVRRQQSENRVEVSAQAFTENERLVLVVPPEGTRSYTDHWRSGFLYIARAAGVPLVPSALDYGAKVGEIGAPVDPGQHTAEVMDELRSFYRGRAGRKPELFGPVRLREEAADEINE